MELVVLDFSGKEAARLNTTIKKTVEKCKELYKKMYITHNRFQVSATTQVQNFPDKDQHLKNLQDKLQTNKQSIQKIESIGKKSIRIQVVQASIHKYLFEELLMQSSPKVKEIESHLAKHEVTTQLLNPVDYRVINAEAAAWNFFIG